MDEGKQEVGNQLERRQQILEQVYAVVDELNADRSPETIIEQDEATELFSEGAKLDSLGLVNFIVGTEERIGEAFGVLLTLVHEDALALETSPFRTIGSIVEYIEQLLDASPNA